MSSLWGWQSNHEACSTMQCLTYMCWAVLPPVAAGSWCGFRFPERPVNHSLLLLLTVALTSEHWTNTHPPTLATIFADQAFLSIISWHFNIFFFSLSPATLPFEFCYSLAIFECFFPSLFIISLKFHVRWNHGRVSFRRGKKKEVLSSIFSPQRNRKNQLLVSSTQKFVLLCFHALHR